MLCRATWLGLALLLSACVDSDDPDQHLADARQNVAQGDDAAAIVNLKAVLQAKPDVVEARQLLGLSLLKAGEPAAAAVELRKALSLGGQRVDLLPPLARALVASGQHQRLLDDHAGDSLPGGAAQTDFRTSLAAAYQQLGEPAKARALLKLALAVAPGHVPALLLKARLDASEHQVADALRTIETALAKAPEDAAAWVLKGQMLAQDGRDLPGAAAAYREALARQARQADAHAGLIGLLLQQGDSSAAAAQAAAMAKALPQHPATAYIGALLAMQANDATKARTQLQPLLAQQPTPVLALHLAALIERQAGALPKAETLLAKAVQLAPDQALFRRDLAQVHLHQGQAAQAQAALQPLLAGATPDHAALTLSGEAWLLAGDVKRAEAQFARVAASRPQDPRNRTAASLAQLGKGHDPAVLAGLQAIARSGNDTQADLALVLAQIRKGDLAAALVAVDALDRKLPGRAVAAQLRGQVHQLRHDLPAARRAFEAALKADPTYLPAAHSLAALDLADNQPDAARQRYDAILAADPANLPALTALAALAQRSGAGSASVQALLAKAIRLNPAEPAPRIALVQYLLARKDANAAQAAAADAVAALPGHTELLAWQVRAELAAGGHQQALATANRLAAAQPNSAEPALLLADVHQAAKRPDQAAASLRRALQIQPDALPVVRRLHQLELAAGRPDQALALARDLQKRQPQTPDGLLLEASAEASRQQWDAAIRLCRSAFQQFPGTETAMRLHSTLLAGQRNADAADLATSWLKGHPRDAGFHNYLGDGALTRGDEPVAERHYRAVLAAEPRHASALNNLAWLLARRGKPEAVDLARQAVALSPASPPVLDTLALALEGRQQWDEAQAVRRRATALAPDSRGLRLALVRLYARSGQLDQARRELDDIPADGASAAEQKLMAQLKDSLR